MVQFNAGLDEKGALVTGGARGIGRGIAETLAEHGCDLVVNDVDGDALSTTVDALDTDTVGGVVGVEADVSDPEAAARLVKEAAEALEGLDVLVNNAAIIDPDAYADITAEDWRRVLGVNLDGVQHCCSAAVEEMRADGGVIVNISSIAGQGVSNLGGAHYTTSKWGVIGLTKHVAAEHGNEGIRANAVCPGPTDTERIRELTDEAVRDEVEASVPLGRWADPGEVGTAVAYLASDAASFVTGTTVTVDGGLSLG